MAVKGLKLAIRRMDTVTERMGRGRGVVTTMESAGTLV